MSKLQSVLLIFFAWSFALGQGQTKPSSKPKSPPKSVETEMQDAPFVNDTDKTGTSKGRRSFSDSLKFGGGIIYTAGTLDFHSYKVTTSGTSSSGSASYSGDGGLGFVAEVAMMGRQTWGFNGGLGIERKDLKTFTSNVSGVNNAAGQSLTLILLYGNLVYRWERLFVPLGLNFTFPRVENASPVLQNLRGSWGYQMGLGWMFSENFALATELRWLSFVAPSNEVSSTVSVEGGRGSMLGFELSAKGYFF